MVKRLLRRLRSQQGFGLIELLMALTILNIGILAIIAAFTSGSVAIRRANRVSTATALADSQMELYRGIVYGSIALDASSVSSAAQSYKCDAAVGSPSSPCPTPSEVTTTCSAPLPNQCKASRAATGADQSTYQLDTYIQWDNSAVGGRTMKKVTVVVRDATSAVIYAREASTFDAATG